MNDISQEFKWNPCDAIIGRKLVELEKTPEAVKYFAEKCNQLSDYAYWFFLSTLWVSYSGISDLEIWKRLFSSDRPKKKKSIMKPSELKAFENLPWFVTVYRAHRPEENDCIAYTLNKDIAFRFAREREVNSIKEYKAKKNDITALFLRREEDEIIILDKEKVSLIREHTEIIEDNNTGFDKCELCGSLINMYNARLVFKQGDILHNFCMDHEGTEELKTKIKEITCKEEK